LVIHNFLTVPELHLLVKNSEVRFWSLEAHGVVVERKKVLLLNTGRRRAESPRHRRRMSAN